MEPVVLQEGIYWVGALDLGYAIFPRTGLQYLPWYNL
jgi:hypothetical protein